VKFFAINRPVGRATLGVVVTPVTKATVIDIDVDDA
jgi:hypothetical protein